jgi:hypothetical protein
MLPVAWRGVENFDGQKVDKAHSLVVSDAS